MSIICVFLCVLIILFVAQTQELATAVVQTILTDKEIAYQTVAFLRDATTVPEVQEALLKLTIHILQHPGFK